MLTGAAHSRSRHVLLTAGAFVAGLVGAWFASSPATAGLVQWRNRVPAVESNSNNIGFYINTLETGNGGTIGYDPGLDVTLDTSLVPNNRFFVTYITHSTGEQMEYEFAQALQPGQSYTARLSFENDGGFCYTPNTLEFLASDFNSWE